ncbi:Uncharacterised protein [Escherichia coli]|nr:Uncharacterised protein [Escherichia coli]
MLVHSILCMFTPLPSVSQHALASSTHKGRGFLLCSGCSLNHFGDFLLQRVARLHSLSTGENGLPGSFDVCWRESLSKLRGVPLQRTSKTGNWTSLPGSTHFLNAAALQHTLIRGVSALDCENGRLQNFPGLSSQLNSRDSRLF